MSNLKYQIREELLRYKEQCESYISTLSMRLVISNHSGNEEHSKTILNKISGQTERLKWINYYLTRK